MMKERIAHSLYGHPGALLPWRIVTAIMLCSIILFPMPAALYSAPNDWPAPTLIAPASGTTATVLNYPPTAVPVFEWEPVPGATEYRIQIDDDSCAFTDPIRYNITTPNTKYIPTSNANFANNTNWCWRVRVEQPTPAGIWSEMRQFTKDWSTGNAPTLISPAPDATVEFFENPIFSWSPVTGAADYVLKLDNDSNCGSPNSTYTTLSTSYNLNTRLANGTYYWCVTPRDAANRDGLTSEIRQITVGYAQIPQLLEPADYSTPVYTPVFRWTAVKGAISYNLQYSTDSSFATKTPVNTKQTTYTPVNSMPNDQTYYWRVAAVYGGNWEGPFSSVWRFTKHWYHQPVLLTPRSNELTNVPLFTWTPVREARKYKIEGSFDPGFSTKRWSVDTTNTFYWRDAWTSDEWDKTIYWRVIPYENGLDNNPGRSSVVNSFVPTYSTAVPENIWPRYFYSPPFIASGNYTIPYNIPISYDYTVDTPAFYWSRTFVPGVDPRIEAKYYRLEVDDSPNFDSPNWVIETENLSATPTDDNPFLPAANTNYFWRVRAYGADGLPLPDSQRNQHWVTQIDVARQITPTATTSPVLQFPAHGEKVFETMPAFEWLPQQGAVRYELMLSTDPAFSTAAYVTRTVYTQHTPFVRLPIGTYFWRVRGLNSSDGTVGTWSDGRRLIVGMQTRWRGVNAYTLGALPSSYDSLLAADTDEGLGATELTSLYVAQDKDNWLIGFHVTPTLGSTVWYGLYLDGNQQTGNGASFAPTGRPALTTSEYFRPEFALYVRYNDTTLVTDTVYLHQWSGTEWDTNGYKNLVDPEDVIGGAMYYTATLGYVELRVPKTAIGDEGDKPFSLSVALFSATSSSATTASDTVPDNGVAPSVLNEFKTIADRVTLASPTGALPGERPTLPYSPYIYAESPNTDLVGGYKVEVARDPQFTSKIQTLETTCTGCEPYPDVFQYVFTIKSIFEDNTIYWRYSIRHKFGGAYYNAPPSEPHLFTKSGPTPANMRTEGNYSTPRFIWDAVEGAGNYQFESATNPEFSQNQISKDVNHESYTPTDAYAPGTYYWRVRAENSLSPAYEGKWSPVSTIVITLPTTSLVEPAMGSVVHRIPTFKWNAYLTPGDANTIGWSAPKYRLQVANNPNFSNLTSVDLDTTTWTPTGTYADGNYYWRVAVLDFGNRPGPFSSVYTFTKQYPAVTLVSPIPGSPGSDGAFPTFIWEPVNGAARYKIEISVNPQFSPVLDSVETDNTVFTPLKKYTATQYYWRVAMKDKSGSYGPWSDAILIDPYPYDIFLPLVLRNKQ